MDYSIIEEAELVVMPIDPPTNPSPLSAAHSPFCTCVLGYLVGSAVVLLWPKNLPLLKRTNCPCFYIYKHISVHMHNFFMNTGPAEQSVSKWYCFSTSTDCSHVCILYDRMMHCRYKTLSTLLMHRHMHTHAGRANLSTTVSWGPEKFLRRQQNCTHTSRGGLVMETQIMQT